MNERVVPPIPSFKVVDGFRHINKGTLKAFFSVQIAGKVIIHDCRIVQQEGQKPWASLPQSEYTNKDGKKVYRPIVELPDAWRRTFSDSACDAYLQSLSGEDAQDFGEGF